MKKSDCVELTKITMKQPLKMGYRKYKVVYSYLKVEVELDVQASSIFNVFKWLNDRIEKEFGSLDGVKMSVVKIKK